MTKSIDTPLETPSTTKQPLFSEKEKVAPLKKYKVIIHNDHYTTIDFVIHVLVTIFKKDYPAAYKITTLVHHRGSGVAGIYPKEVAETKVSQAEELAELNEFPLRFTLQKET